MHFDRAHLDLLWLVIWSRVFWPSVTWNLHKRTALEQKRFDLSLSPTLRNLRLLLVIYICVDFIQGACTESLDSQVQGATNHPPHPWSLWLVSSASSVMTMSHRIDLAGLTRRKYSLTLHCFLTWNSNQSDKVSTPFPPGFHTRQVSHPPMDRSGSELLTPSKTASPQVFFRLRWLEHRRCPCSSENLLGTF